MSSVKSYCNYTALILHRQNIHFSLDISALWSECYSRYINTRTYSNATLCKNVKAIGEELSEI
jgi:hypothetical protein